MGLRSALPLVLLSLAACDTAGAPEPTASVVVEPGVLRTYVGDRNARFTASAPDVDGATYEWSSSDPEVCHTTPTGGCRTITRLGRATITVLARDRDGHVVGRGEALLLSEVESVGPTPGAVLAFTRGPRGVLAGGYGPAPLQSSSDAGQTWTEVSTFPSRDIVEFVASSPADPALAVASATDRAQFAASDASSAQFLTEDGGRTWRRLAPVADGDRAPVRVVGVVFHPARRGTIYVLGVGWTGGDARALLFESADLGASWRLAADLPRRGFVPPTLFLDPTDGDRVYVLNDAPPDGGGGFASADGGVTWAAWDEGTPSRTIAVDGAGRLYGIAYPQGGTGVEQVVRSDDGGRSWTALFDEREGYVAYAGTLGRDVIAVGVNRYTNHGHTVRVSFDAGDTWATVPLTPADGQTFAQPHAIALVSDDGRAVEGVLSFSGRADLGDPGVLIRLRLHRERP